jgi:large subunit ribosomal protein L18
MIKRVNRKEMRQRRHRRIRMRVAGTTQRPRICVFRSSVHIYAQIIDDSTGRTLVQASSLDKDVASVEPILPAPAPVVVKEEVKEKVEKGGKPGADKGGKQPAKVEAKAEPKPAAVTEASKHVRLAQQVGTLLARRAQEKGIKAVVFDRGGYIYHGRVKALAESARAAGLEF